MRGTLLSSTQQQQQQQLPSRGTRRTQLFRSLQLVRYPALGVLLLAITTIVGRYSYLAATHEEDVSHLQILKSCYFPIFRYVGRKIRDPARIQLCSPLVRKARARGRGVEWNFLRSQRGRRFHGSLDGCQTAHSWTAEPSEPSHRSDAGNPDGEAEYFVTKGLTSSSTSSPSSFFPSSGACSLEWVTFSSECSTNVNRLAAACAAAGIPLAVLGLDMTWPGYGGRLRVLLDYVSTLPPDRIVIVTDADDVVLLPTSFCSPSSLLSSFLSLQSPVVFGAEIYCFPQWWITEQLYPPPPNGSSPFKFLNAGNYIGYAWAVADIMRRAYSGDCVDDQWRLTWAFLNRTSFVLPSSSSSGFISLPRMVLQYTAEAVDVNTTCVSSPSSAKHSIKDAGQQQEEGCARAHQYIKLDHYNRLFLLLGKVGNEGLEVSGNRDLARVRVKETQGYPCILHQQGDKQVERGVILEELLERMGLLQ